MEPPRLLAVDDEPQIVELYEMAFGDAYDVVTAASGRAALDAVEREGDFDVALLDRRMPGVSGDEVLERLAEVAPDCRVAMVTAVQPDFDVLEMPFDEYLVKPVTRTDVRETVERLLRLKTYRERCREEYALASKVAALRTHKASSSLEGNQEYQALLERLDALRAELDRTAADLTTDDFAAAFADIGASASRAHSTD